MTANQKSFIEDLENTQLELSNKWIEYWNTYSNFGTWQFWTNLSFLLIPLIVLYFFIDKRKALLIGFYGFNVHVWFTYIDIIGGERAYWFYPYKVFPILPTGFALDVALVPVAYMLVYQWTLKHKKNYYLYILALCAVLAFVFKPLLVSLDLFELNRGANYFHLFLGYAIVAVISKIITNIFVSFEKNAK
ncbi:hypothetical protein CVD25_00635 [Bacillus canaveralius]|uniref:Uncharacterized protein n=1 Tax=Bacillus canaveralius TaxID=1403243 RepID=A0A2N5GG08_9BACI|nr:MULTISPECIES: CBO0543 family protein [Bacillus]PLR79661.1 hypothetical protein CU635_21915 [Bacillus canaveralius]PLR80849.1 hypothetical protein CVD23_20195 [Bacillus sp. V33-4]PLS00853.1 hypothetical protein CVD25_00635 [Bacillus canaveralius]RSK53798.1 hypothetical protein EJA13_07325 [Bacillus canaveralius]